MPQTHAKKQGKKKKKNKKSREERVFFSVFHVRTDESFGWVVVVLRYITLCMHTMNFQNQSLHIRFLEIKKPVFEVQIKPRSILSGSKLFEICFRGSLIFLFIFEIFGIYFIVESQQVQYCVNFHYFLVIFIDLYLRENTYLKYNWIIQEKISNQYFSFLESIFIAYFMCKIQLLTLLLEFYQPTPQKRQLWFQPWKSFSSQA
eukprot:TRINITY_DN1545_c0_g1_i1.p3 TRINITY_DN1545_c0_g1~~TRINITY_DN1545_c0_g1_i1.p3  ORF type:complete len:203 (+),score=-3.93 TRINITY_DN1545_c0_g1_i1:75-683(+)